MAWIEDLADALGVERLTDEETQSLLGSARDIAHRVERMWTPVSAYLIGVAVGRGASLADVRATVENLLPAEG